MQEGIGGGRGAPPMRCHTIWPYLRLAEAPGRGLMVHAVKSGKPVCFGQILRLHPSWLPPAHPQCFRDASGDAFLVSLRLRFLPLPARALWLNIETICLQARHIRGWSDPSLPKTRAGPYHFPPRLKHTMSPEL